MNTLFRQTSNWEGIDVIPTLIFLCMHNWDKTYYEVFQDTLLLFAWNSYILSISAFKDIDILFGKRHHDPSRKRRLSAATAVGRTQ